MQRVFVPAGEIVCLANAVAGQLSGAGGVEAGRLYEVEPQLEVPAGEEGLESQAVVQLSIK